MNVIAVDDEPLALRGLVNEIQKAEPDCKIRSFTDPAAALHEVTECGFRPDVVFLDIEMPGIQGLELARRTEKECPEANIIFVTSHSQYALSAHNLHASGYLMKPVLAEDIRHELSDLRRPLLRQAGKVRIQTFGNFDVFVDGSPLSFPRAKAKEALAYIVSRNGGSVTTAELASILWEEKKYDRSLQHQTQTVISDMMKTLRAVCIDDILIKKHNCISLDVSRTDCDFTRFLRRDPQAVALYTGEFMSSYSWAEMISGYLDYKFSAAPK